MNIQLRLSLLVLILAFQSCSKEEDDLISQNCETNCTEIVGKIMTDRGIVPISDLKLTVKWDNIPYLGSGIIRTKAITHTDSEGNFSLKFYMRDDEIEDGSFYIEYDIDETQYLAQHSDRISIFQISRDTSLNINYNIPRKAFLNVSFLNLDNVQPPNRLTTEFSYERFANFDQPIDGQVRSWNHESEQNNLIEIVGNQSIELKIHRRINATTTIQTDTLFFDAGTTTNYTIDFNN